MTITTTPYAAPKVRSKDRWCHACKSGRHAQCTKVRKAVDRKLYPCECKCDLRDLDPEL